MLVTYGFAEETVTYIERAVKGGDQAQATENQADPTANDAKRRFVWDLIKRVALGLPGTAEADVGGADGAPDEEVGQPGQRKQPGKDSALFGSLANECQEAEGNLDDDTPDGTTAAIDIGKRLGSHTSLSHGLHRTGRAEGARVGDRDDREGDDGVEDGGKDLDTRILNSQDERTGLGIGTAGSQQSVVVRSDDEPKNEKIDDVEEEDSPKDLLGGTGNRLPRVGGLGSSKTDQLSAAKSEGSGDKDGAEAVEAVSKGAGVVPVLGAQVSLVANTTTVDHDAEDDEADTGANLDHGENEFDFTIATDTEDLDGSEHDKEDSHPNTWARLDDEHGTM